MSSADLDTVYRIACIGLRYDTQRCVNYSRPLVVNNNAQSGKLIGLSIIFACIGIELGGFHLIRPIHSFTTAVTAATPYNSGTVKSTLFKL